MALRIRAGMTLDFSQSITTPVNLLSSAMGMDRNNPNSIVGKNSFYLLGELNSLGVQKDELASSNTNHIDEDYGSVESKEAVLANRRQHTFGFDKNKHTII